jgi:beta-1,2-mannobiose phosphorylase / 1,2-beta-oligomannan phosphorylase
MKDEILERYHKNPILLPNESNWWESKAVFNCGILYYEDKIHMLYRAVGEYEKYISRAGYASSTDGFYFDREKETIAAFVPVEEYEKYGIEDPRLVEIDHQVYVTYVVPSTYVHQGSIASTALATTTDFSKYTRLGIITTKESDNKDVVLFPGKIVKQQTQQISSSNLAEEDSKYLFLHRPSSWIGSKYGVDRPSIWLGEGNSLTNFEKHMLLIKPEQEWEALKVGAGPPPIKTKHGWLLIYHGVDNSRVYRAGAAVLDLKDPSKVIGRTAKPILEPKEPYEKKGDVNNVVFPTGVCVIDGTLFVYYGAADKVCCLATADLEDLLDYILRH